MNLLGFNWYRLVGKGKILGLGEVKERRGWLVRWEVSDIILFWGL